MTSHLLLSLLPDDGRIDFGVLIPGFMVLNLIITTFYFIGGLVLLKKSEGTLAGLVVTPLRDSEYLVAKMASLTLLAVVESLLIVGLVVGADFCEGGSAMEASLMGCAYRLLLLVAGMMLLGGFYTLIGFVAIARYDSINEYLLPSAALVTLLMLPLLDHFGLWQSVIFYLHPVQPALLLMRAGFVSLEWWQMGYGGSLLCFGLSFQWAHRTFYRFVVRSAGG